jgi:very-short-patch-repair endonuclease/predicted transcriptional regulator of viral defense system
MARGLHVLHDMDAQREARRLDAAIAALAKPQHGVVARGQLVDLGLGRGAIEHRVRCGRLHPLHRGVFAVGHRAVSRDAAWLAAVLAAGDGAALSYRSAAALWGIRQSGRARVEVSVPRHRRSSARLELHWVPMQPDEITSERGIPVTTPARTLFDLAAVVSEEQLERAFDEAEVRRLTSPTSLDALLARYPGRKGAPAIRKVLAKHAAVGQTVTRSELERRFLSLVDASGLPRPRMNRAGDQGELDATWHDERLVVELDGFAVHGTRRAFEDDRARDRALQVAGWRVVRITWRQLRDEPDTIAVQLSALLGVPAAMPRTPSPRSARRGPRRRRPTPATPPAAP